MAELIGALAIIIMYFGVICLCIYGYIHNIIELVHANSITGMAIARAIGIVVAPAGIILGFI